MKSSILHQENKKDTLRSSHKSLKFNLSQVQGLTAVKLSLKRESLSPLLKNSCPGNWAFGIWFTVLSCPCSQKHLQTWLPGELVADLGFLISAGT